MFPRCARCVTASDIEFFPINRAITLEGSNDEENTTKNRLDRIEEVCAGFAEFQFGTLTNLHTRLNVVVEELRKYQRSKRSN